jgi:hypothetical protein
MRESARTSPPFHRPGAAREAGARAAGNHWNTLGVGQAQDLRHLGGRGREDHQAGPRATVRETVRLVGEQLGCIGQDIGAANHSPMRRASAFITA